MSILLRTRAALLTIAVAAPASGCAAQLRTSVHSECEDAGLQACSELADGVVLFASGDNDKKARSKLELAASNNDRSKLEDFADTLRGLEKIPRRDGAADVLTASEAMEMTAEESTVAQAAAPITDSELEPDGPVMHHDPRFVESKMTVVPTEGDCATGLDSEEAPAACANATHGPLLLTDAVASPGCGSGAFIAAVKRGAASWRVDGGADRILLSGGRFALQADQRLVVGSSTPGADCRITWSAQRSARVDMPLKPGREAIRSALKPVRIAAKACGKEHSAAGGTIVTVRFAIDGPSGKITGAAATDPHAGTPLGNCVATAAMDAIFEPFRKPQQIVTFPFSM